MTASILRAPTILLSLIFLSYFVFGLFHISQFITADEHYWIYERIPQYWNALEQGNWRKTFINDKPGISLAMVSGAALLYDQSPMTLCSENEQNITICNQNRSEMLLFFFRLPLLLFNFFILLYLFFIIKKLSGENVALLSVLFMGLSPMLLGITQIVNPDALLWSTGAAALFSFFLLLQSREKKYIFVSGFFLALSILSKYTASFLLPIFLLTAALSPFIEEEAKEKKLFGSLLKENLLFFFGTFLFAFLLGVVFLPATWDNPLILLRLFWGGGAVSFPFSLLIFPGIFIFDILFFRSTLTHKLRLFFDRVSFFDLLQRAFPLIIFVFVVGLIIGRAFFPEWDLFDKIPFDLKDLYSNNKFDKYYLPNPLQSFVLELNPLVFSLTPIALLSFLSFCLFQIFHKRDSSHRNDVPVFSSFFFFLSFLIVYIFSEVLATPRYLIMLYPLVAYLAALGWEKLFLILSVWIRKYRSLSIPAWSWNGIAFLFSLLSLALIAPFYFNFTNAFLPKDKIIQHAWGYGGYEAAQYLNNLPDAEKMTVWTDYYGVCEFFVGRCMALEYASARITSFDYVVLSARGKALYNPEHSRWKKPGNFYLNPLYQDPHPLFELDLGGRKDNFVKVLKFVKL